MTRRGVIASLGALLPDCKGSMVIETAIVAPVLVVLSIGGFEVSAMVARQTELQSAAAEAVAIVMAASPETQTQIDQIESVVEKSSDLAEENVNFLLKYRCGTGAKSADATACDPDLVTTFIRIEMTDRYTPIWTHYGFGEGLEYKVNRTVQIG